MGVSMQMRGLMADEAEQRWSELQPLVESALNATDSYRDYGPEDVLDKVRERDMQVWAVFDGSAVVTLIITSVVVYPKRNVLEVFLVAGEKLDAWLYGAYDVILAYAKTQGCGGMRFSGRRGWEKILRPLGVTMQTSITGVSFDD